MLFGPIFSLLTVIGLVAIFIWMIQLFIRLTGFDHRRRAGAAHRHGAVRHLSHRLRGRGLHRAVRGDQSDIYRADAGLHRQGHFGGIRFPTVIAGNVRLSNSSDR
jgi:hypothetical protein